MCQMPVLSRMTPQLDNGEEDMMEWHGSGNHRSWLARREATWNAIASSGYLAPSRIGMDEARERTLAEASHARLLANGTRPTRQSGADMGRRSRILSPNLSLFQRAASFVRRSDPIRKRPGFPQISKLKTRLEINNSLLATRCGCATWFR